MPAGAVQHDALFRAHSAGVALRGRVEPKLEYAARHVDRARNKAELVPLAHVADAGDLNLAASD